MHQRGDVIFARDLGGAEIGFDKRGIIPGMDGVMIVSVLNFFKRRVGIALKAFKQCADIFLDHLKLIGNGNAIAVIIDRDDGRCFEHADGVDRFPKETFSR